MIFTKALQTSLLLRVVASKSFKVLVCYNSKGTDEDEIMFLRVTWGPIHCNHVTFNGLETNHVDIQVINTAMQFLQDGTYPHQLGQSTHPDIQGILIPNSDLASLTQFSQVSL